MISVKAANVTEARSQTEPGECGGGQGMGLDTHGRIQLRVNRLSIDFLM